MWKTGNREFSFCEKPELENFFFLSENSRIVENQNRTIFFFFLSENPRIVENQNWRIFFFYPRILVLWKTRIGEFFFFSENSRVVENGNWRILVV